MIKKLFILILCLIFLTGCWDRRELNELGIIMAMGLEQDKNNDRITATFQIVNPNALKQDISSKQSPIEHISTSGKTVSEAIRNITREFDRRGYFAHTKVIVIDEGLAKNGMGDVLDFFLRDQELRRTTWLVIAKDTTVSEIFSANAGLEEIEAVYLTDIIKTGKLTYKSISVTLLDFVKKLSSSGVNPIAGVMEKGENETNYPSEQNKDQPVSKGIIFNGTAVFRKDKLIGYLNSNETRGLNWIISKVDSGIINIPVNDENNKEISIIIKNSKSDIKAFANKDSYKFHITVKIKGDIIEQQSKIDTSNIDQFEKVQKHVEKEVKKEIKTTIKKLQKDLQSDILGFGSILSRAYPKDWKVIEKKWAEIFPDIEYNISVHAKLRKTGAISKPLEFKE